MKSNTTPYYRIKYERIAKRRGKKRAIIAIARMTLTAIGEVWNPVDLKQIDMPPELRDKEIQKSLRRAARLLIAHGLILPDAIQVPVSSSA